MPTVNPRVNVTLPPSLDLLVGRMAAHQRCSKSQVLRELLEAAEPALQRAVALMDAASQAAGAVKQGLAKSLDQAQSEAEKHAATMLARMEGITGDLVAQAEVIRERRPARKAEPRSGRRAPSDPPASKRGVKSPSTRKTRGKP